MKLLIYSHFFAPSIGGVETIVLSLARGLADSRTPHGFAEFELTLATETPAEEFDDRMLPFRVLRQPSLRHLLRAIRSSDMVHVAGPAISPLVLGLLTRRPVVIEHHGFQAICPTGQLLIEPKNAPCPGHFMAGRHLKCLRCRSDDNWLASGKLWFLTFVRRFLSARAAANIMPTEWLSELIHLPSTLPVPHGIETITPRFEPEHPSRPPLIMFQGRLVSTKGLPILLEAASILRSENREFQMLVIGEGPERPTLQGLAEKLQLSSRIRFVGQLPTADLDSVIANVSMVIVPSLGGEVFGLVLAENMLRGLPVIASDLGCFAEILGDAGLTFRVGDAHDLATQIARLLDDSALASRFGARARQRIFDFYSRGHMIEAHARLYRRIHEAAYSEHYDQHRAP
jgi:glycosyltransferase involved in cell wall biosynthesis